MRLYIIPLLIALATGGCGAAGAVVDLATLPVRGASKAVDVATVSQSERDERRGRELREREERIGKLERQAYRWEQDCRDGDVAACRKRDGARAEIESLLPGAAPEPR